MPSRCSSTVAVTAPPSAMPSPSPVARDARLEARALLAGAVDQASSPTHANAVLLAPKGDHSVVRHVSCHNAIDEATARYCGQGAQTATPGPQAKGRAEAAGCSSQKLEGLGTGHEQAGRAAVARRSNACLLADHPNRGERARDRVQRAIVCARRGARGRRGFARRSDVPGSADRGQRLIRRRRGPRRSQPTRPALPRQTPRAARRQSGPATRNRGDDITAATGSRSGRHAEKRRRVPRQPPGARAERDGRTTAGICQPSRRSDRRSRRCRLPTQCQISARDQQWLKPAAQGRAHRRPPRPLQDEQKRRPIGLTRQHLQVQWALRTS